jgi:hypothetical protein
MANLVQGGVSVIRVGGIEFSPKQEAKFNTNLEYYFNCRPEILRIDR